MPVIAVDCGGGSIRCARAEGVRLGPVSRVDPPERVEDLPGAIARLVGDPGAATALGVGMAGLVDAPAGVLRWMPHCPGGPVALRDGLEGLLGLSVAVDNDANLAGLAEATQGAGAGHRMVLTVTVGTGIGGGLVVDGRIERGRGHLGEVGHIVLDPGGPPCACGLRGCWEALASGTALDAAGRRLAATRGVACPGRGAAAPWVVGKAVAGDPEAVAVVAAVGRHLGRGLAALVAAFDPDVLVIGGGVAAAGEAILGPARAAMMAGMPGGGHRTETPVVAARFGTEAGLVGAALAAGGAA